MCLVCILQARGAGAIPRLALSTIERFVRLLSTLAVELPASWHAHEAMHAESPPMEGKCAHGTHAQHEELQLDTQSSAAVSGGAAAPRRASRARRGGARGLRARRGAAPASGGTRSETAGWNFKKEPK